MFVMSCAIPRMRRSKHTLTHNIRRYLSNMAFAVNSHGIKLRTVEANQHQPVTMHMTTI